jgi:hypothetical protein
MSSAFFWLAIFPLIVGSIGLAICIAIIKREGRKPEKFENNEISKSAACAEFINDVARRSNVDEVEAEKIIEFVFSYFPWFDWREELRKEKGARLHREDGE